MENKILRLGNVADGYGAYGIILDQIFSVEKVEDNKFRLREECDAWYSKDLTKAELLLMIEELKNWVEEQ
jgi:hypothetical protein